MENLLALSNLIIFSYFEKEPDERDGCLSLALYLGQRLTKRLALGLLLLGLLICVLLLLITSSLMTRQIQVLIFTLNFLLLILLLKEDFFRQYGLYRIIGDGVFLIPVLFLLYTR